ncbi:MAG: spermidine synthase [Myxococcota bacterium]
MQPWEVLDTAQTDDGELGLSARGREGAREFLITVDRRVLMNSFANRSELAVAEVACEPLATHPAPRVLIGGLGMGCTLRAALDVLPPTAQITVAELHGIIATWCEGPLAAVNGEALSDPRVTIVVADVAALIRRSEPGSFDAIVLDLFEGPHSGTDANADPFYGRHAIEHSARALRPQGVFSVWSEEHDAGFERRLTRAGFSVHRTRPGRGGLRHAVYAARLTKDDAPPKGKRPGGRKRSSGRKRS